MTSVSKPNIFEIFSLSQFKSLAREALRYLFKILVNQFPSMPRALYYKFDEVYILLELIVESINYKVYNCSFSELLNKFVRSGQNGAKSTNLQLVVSLIFDVILPYFKKKLSNKLFLKIFGLIDLINFVFKLTYATNLTSGHSIVFNLFRLSLVYETPDLENKDFSKILIDIVRFSLELCTFFIRFLDNWFTKSRIPLFFQAVFIDCPEKIDPSVDRNKCLICSKPKINPTVVSSTGYVFCFKCVDVYVKVFKRCPVTFYPVSTDHLIKLN